MLLFYRFLGYGSVVLLFLLIAPALLKHLNKTVFHRNRNINKMIAFLRKHHKFFGILMLIISVIHGYQLMGGFRLHTGSLLYLMLGLSALSGYYFSVKKKRHLLQIHKFLCVLSLVLLGVHYFFPSALYYLLNR